MPLTERQGFLGEAEQIYRQAIASGDDAAVPLLAEMLDQHGRVDDADQLFHTEIAAGKDSPYIRHQLGLRLRRHGRLEELEQFLRDAVAAGIRGGRNELVRLLEEQGRTGEVYRLRHRGLDAYGQDPPSV